MKMYIQLNELSHNVGLILVVILFDTFFYYKVEIITNMYCNISQNVAFWLFKSNLKKHNTWVTYDGLVNLLVFSELESIQKFGYQQNNSVAQLSRDKLQMKVEVVGTIQGRKLFAEIRYLLFHRF